MMAYNSGQHSIVLVCAVVISLVAAVIALILSAVAVSQSGTSNISILTPYSGQSSRTGTGNDGNDEDKIWQLALHERGFRLGYIDDATGELRGFNADMANAVCQIANKNCQIVYDSSQRCWDAVSGTRAQGGKGLLSGYYDGCVGWVHSYDRPRTFRFSDPYTDSLPAAALITLQGNPGNFTWQDLAGSKIGFIDGFVNDEHCLARSNVVTGNKLSSGQIVHYLTRPAAQQGLRNNEVDAIFDAKLVYLNQNPDFQIVSDDILTCVKAGFSVMTRKDSRLIDWWNPAFATLTATSQWKYICNDLDDEHGHVSRGPGPSVCVGID
ncbi:uncharacterized protein [Amphiura filiformis]|uniref:uncharacterized protein n=1 Tax=Amphiura filiformis TaxID=82378 RepID=UPI003B215998